MMIIINIIITFHEILQPVNKNQEKQDMNNTDQILVSPDRTNFGFGENILS
jgi:hypothetical protein